MTCHEYDNLNLAAEEKALLNAELEALGPVVAEFNKISGGGFNGNSAKMEAYVDNLIELINNGMSLQLSDEKIRSIQSDAKRVAEMPGNVYDFWDGLCEIFPLISPRLENGNLVS